MACGSCSGKTQKGKYSQPPKTPSAPKPNKYVEQIKQDQTKPKPSSSRRVF